MIPWGIRGADLGIGAVGEDDKGVEPEDLADGVPVVTQVVVVCVPHVLVRHLQLDKHEGDAVDEQHDVGPPAVHLARHPELRDREPVVRVDVVPVDEPHGDRLAAAIDLGVDLHSVAQKPVYFAVRAHPIHGRSGFGEDLDGYVECLVGNSRVDLPQRTTKAVTEHHLGLGVTAERASWAKDLVEA